MRSVVTLPQVVLDLLKWELKVDAVERAGLRGELVGGVGVAEHPAPDWECALVALQHAPLLLVEGGKAPCQFVGSRALVERAHRRKAGELLIGIDPLAPPHRSIDVAANGERSCVPRSFWGTGSRTGASPFAVVPVFIRLTVGYQS